MSCAGDSEDIRESREASGRTAADPACFVKLAPTAAEVAVLSAAPALGLPAPTLLAWVGRVGDTPVAAAGAPPAGTIPEAICLEGLPGHPLAAALHAGGAIPMAAWAEAMARIHRIPLGAARAAIPGLPERAAPSRWLAERLPALVSQVGRAVAVDVGPLLLSAAQRLPATLTGPDPDPVFCHGDWAADHVLVRRGAVSGVCAWDRACVARPGDEIAAAVVDLFARGLSARAALALGDSLAAAYAAATGQPAPAWAFPMAAVVLERAADAAVRRAAGQAGGDAVAWSALLGMCLARG